jgi:hypothetical protein
MLLRHPKNKDFAFMEVDFKSRKPLKKYKMSFRFRIDASYPSSMIMVSSTYCICEIPPEMRFGKCRPNGSSKLLYQEDNSEHLPLS